MPVELPDNLLPPPAWRESAMHSAYLRIAFALAEQLGQSAPARVPGAARLLPFLDVVPVLDLLDAPRQPLLGAQLGARISAAAHGALGYAAMSSATVGQVLDTIARYTLMRNRMFTYECRSGAQETVLRLVPRVPMGAYRDFVEIGTAVSVFKIVQLAAGDEAAARMSIHAAWKDEGALPLPMPVRHGQPVTLLRVPAAVAALPTLTGDARLYASACRNCEEELAMLDGSIVARLRAIMPYPDQTWPALQDAARHMAMSSRTLIRRLEAEGHTYQSLLDEAKGEMACWYLRNTALPMSQVAGKLGYLDDSNFSRSFRRWRGVTPLAYRRNPGLA